ncbi:MAG: NifU family protein [Acidimicrobiia bacterium]|jgi:Fe-S cluster biogenesis protein NfuA
MDQDAVATTVDEMGALLRSDGADLRLVDANPKTARIEVALELEGAECEECVLAPELLEQMINDALSRSVVGEFELVLRDPRRT